MNTANPQDEVSAVTRTFGAGLRDPTRPFTLLVRFQVRPAMTERIVAAFAKAAVPTQPEEGMIAFELNRECADSTRFVVHERWRSLADLDAHLRTPYIEQRAEVDRALVGKPEFVLLEPV